NLFMKKAYLLQLEILVITVIEPHRHFLQCLSGYSFLRHSGRITFMFEFGPETSKEPSSCALLRIHKIG
ncbi:hypothetical protein L0N21_18560, partial [Fusicatenibacter saccharivorans]